jgi:hypothetical protein
LADCSGLHVDVCSVSDAHVLRWKRFLFDLGQFRLIVKSIADSDARHGSFAFTHADAHQQRHYTQSG